MSNDIMYLTPSKITANRRRNFVRMVMIVVVYRLLQKMI
jgi:hypothetical protein